MTAIIHEPRLINGLANIASQFDAVILDLWGCLHDGVRIYDAALDCVKRLRGHEKRIIIMSNAPRRSALVAERIADMGLTPDLYDRLAASGEETWQALKSEAIRELVGARRVHAIMAERDASLLEGLPFERAADPNLADFILAVGVEGPQSTISEFEPALRIARGRNLAMVCANPDLLVHRGGVPEICAGQIALRYHEMGGRVHWFGKPYAGIYRRALGGFRIKTERVLCVGDSLRTDIAGGLGVGAGALLIAGGIHEGEVMQDGKLATDRLGALCRRMNVTPDYAMTYLAW